MVSWHALQNLSEIKENYDFNMKLYSGLANLEVYVDIRALMWATTVFGTYGVNI